MWWIAYGLMHMEAYSDPCQASMMGCFEKIFTLTIFEKNFTFDI